MLIPVTEVKLQRPKEVIITSALSCSADIKLTILIYRFLSRYQSHGHTCVSKKVSTMVPKKPVLAKIVKEKAELSARKKKEKGILMI